MAWNFWQFLTQERFVDTRAELLLEELVTHPRGRQFDFPYWRERFQNLFSEQLDLETRVKLLQAYVAILDLVERGIVANGGNLDKFRQAREVDWRALCLQEAQLRNEGGYILPEDISEIVEREVVSGRMIESDYTRFIADAVSILPSHRKVRRKTKGFFARLFG
ncbi:MAG: hypothetical protein KJ703_11310 [Alphaproteobacteria bacterium]|nr:hypothetical protein [Alphaproteobacteria bacterium]